MKLLLLFFVTAAFFIYAQGQICEATPSEKVCKISEFAKVRDFSPHCSRANNALSSPGSGSFTTPGPGNEECINMINADGSRCVWSYARLFCSYLCVECLEGIPIDNAFICGSRCTETAIRCPTANAAGCFDAIFERCVGDNQPCSNIGVNKDVIDISDAAPNPGQRK